VDGKAIPNPERAAIVRCWVDLLLSGGTLADVSFEMERRGTLSPKGAPRWGRSTITRILRDPALKGKFYAFSEHMEAPSFYEPARRVKNAPTLVYEDKDNGILTDAEWQAVQERLEANKQLSRRNTRYHYGPLHRLVRCEPCDRAFGVTDGHRGAPAFRCPQCRRRLNAQQLWQRVKPELVGFFSNPTSLRERLEKQALRGVPVERLEAEIEACRRELEALAESETRAVRMGITLPGYLEEKLEAELQKVRRRRDEVQGKLVEREERIAQLQRSQFTVKELTMLAAVQLSGEIQNLPDDDWARFLRQINFTVVVGENTLRYLFNMVLSQTDLDQVKKRFPEERFPEITYGGDALRPS